MKTLLNALQNEKGFAAVLSALEAGRCPAVLSGLGPVHRSYAAAALQMLSGRPVAAVCAGEAEAARMAADMAALLGTEVPVVPGRELTLHDAQTASRETEHRRLQGLSALAAGKCGAAVLTADALMQVTIPARALRAACFTLEYGGSYDLDELAARFAAVGYTRCQQVEGMGQFAVRGGILDFYSPAQKSPVRCEFFGDELDSMGIFDVGTQRRTENIRTAAVIPAAEANPELAAGGRAGLLERLDALRMRVRRRKNAVPELEKTLMRDYERIAARQAFPALDRYLAYMYGHSGVLDCLPEDAVVVLCEPRRIAEAVRNRAAEEAEDLTALIERGEIDPSAFYSLSWEEVLSRLEDFAVVMADNFAASDYPLQPRTLESVTAKQLPNYGGSLDTAAGDAAHYLRTGFRTVVLCRDRKRAGVVGDCLARAGVPFGYDYALKALPEKGTCIIAEGGLSAGMEFPASGLAVITEGQAGAGGEVRRPKRKKVSNRERIDSYTDLSPGDYVVHESHGIGRFVGIEKIQTDKVWRDYIKIAYAGTDVLYIPVTQLDMITKYIGGGGEDHAVKLSKMGGTDWSRAKAKAKGAAKELAKGLIAVQAARMREKGHAFPQDDEWQTEFEEAFEYTETDDQLRCIREVKGDMEKPVPMDRLLCGDVGYGKTEVALRAVMKCVLDGMQAAILVPTTVLAQQHYSTILKRFEGYPVKTEVLSRFRTPAQLKKALREIASGGADIVVGTHKLLQKDVTFKKLGLLVVDEEQRFGVAHKERLKELSRNVDVLTLTATPIPRTLNMALSGLRDMSTLEEPPMDRRPVQTYVMEHDWGVLCQAIERETARGGQVYYLHNRIDNIERTAARLSQMLPEVTVAAAHGRMDEEQLGSIMEKMAAGEIQVLVCTTIIETGIDIPNVNTLIIEDADKLGLAQLHQLRGRVGRSNRRAYAYLTFRQGKALSEIAEKRLAAIREFAEFNSGFKIAMRDLEIRGAGNLLGAEQSGHMMSVGYDMYLKLLEEAVLEEKGEKPPVKTECAADIAVDAGIPEQYIPSAEQRLDLYRRIARVRCPEDAEDICDELTDRFGDIPRQVNTLVRIALLRAQAAAIGITEITQKGDRLRLRMDGFDLNRISALYSRSAFKGRVKIDAGTVPAITLKLRPGADPVDEADAFIRAYNDAATQK